VAGDAREIGLRLALGAPRRRVLGGVMRRALGLASAGVIVGLPLAWAGIGGLQTLIAGLRPLDFPLLSGVVVVLVVAVASAAIIPARRAVRIDPLRSLRG
jgi:ABC-type antimicrobial peptide transport system permease subunit